MIENREKITHEYLLEHGYVVDKRETEIYQNHWKEEVEWCKEPLICYYNEDRRIIVRHRWTNRYGEAYDIHIDNQDYDSVGYLEVLYIDDFENFIKLAYDKYID